MKTALTAEIVSAFLFSLMACLGDRREREGKTTRDNEEAKKGGGCIVNRRLPIPLFGCSENPSKSPRLEEHKNTLNDVGGFWKINHNPSFPSLH